MSGGRSAADEFAGAPSSDNYARLIVRQSPPSVRLHSGIAQVHLPAQANYLGTMQANWGCISIQANNSRGCRRVRQ